MKKTTSGFTIVELLVVIVIIGILAAITVVAYNGIQDRARTAKINSDLATLSKAVQSARILNNSTLYDITGTDWTAGPCVNLASGTDLTDKTTHSDCWNNYTQALARISSASGINVNGLVDPWGRPYWIDENETASSCIKDDIGWYYQPYESGWEAQNRAVQVPNYRTAC